MRANFSGRRPPTNLFNLLESKSLFGIQIDRAQEREREIGHNLDQCVTLPHCVAQLCHHVATAGRSMPWRKDGRCELWDPETSLVMELLGGEMGERRGRPDLGVGGAAMALEGRSAGPPVLRCQRVCHYRPGSQHLSTEGE